jgi:hypothetical protein
MRTQRNDLVAGKRIRAVALAAAIAVVLAMLAITTASQASTVKPAATEVGVTGSEIHIAVLAEVDNPFTPNVGIGARDAVTGFANYINTSCATKNRCLAGRKLVVDFYDPHLDPTKTRTAEIQACGSDLAMVGTTAVFLTNIDDMRNCKDQAGATTGIPDIPVLAIQLAQQCSNQSFPITPPIVRCATKARHPQTFDANVARGYYFTKKYGNLHGIYVFPSGSRALRDDALASGLGGLRDFAGVGKGVHSDGDFDVSAVDPQSAYTPVIEAMKANHSNYGQCTQASSCTVLLRREAVLQGITNQVKVWDCGTCYDKSFLQSGGADIEHEYVDLAFLPFYDQRDQQANRMLTNFVHYTGKDHVDNIADTAWAAAVAFRDAVNATVKAHGLNGLTRASMFAALNNIHTFNADGMLAPFDLAARKISDCHVLTQVRNSAFVRVQPTKPGTFDCNPKYVITRKLELLTSP